MKNKAVRFAVRFVVEPLGAKDGHNGAPSPISELGKRLQKLGEALQDGNSNIGELSGMAFDAGLKIRFSLDEKTETVVDLREECDRLIISEHEATEKLNKATYEIALLKALTGIIAASWDDCKGGKLLSVQYVYGAPYGVQPLNASMELTR